MIISLVYAMDQNRVIGQEGDLPWHIPEDLSYFKSLTMGKPIIMGRKTYESIGRPLPGRTNIVLSRNISYAAPGCIVVHSIEAAISAAGDVEEIMVIGGSKVFEQMLPLADRMYVTFIEAAFEGDVLFPNVDWSSWQEVARETDGESRTRSFAIHFVVFQRLDDKDEDAEEESVAQGKPLTGIS